MSEENKDIRTEYMYHVEAQKTSGLSIKNYCARNNLSESKLSYYRGYQLKDSNNSKVQKKASNNNAFAQVELTKSKEAPIKTSLTSTSAVDPKWLAEFLKELHGVRS